MSYCVREVDPADDEISDTISELNQIEPAFPLLTWAELNGNHCYWWLAYRDSEPVAFAGIVPSRLYPNAGYLKRSAVLPEHRGHGLQRRFFVAREKKARAIGWNMIVSETTENIPSANNFIRCGYLMFEPKEPWAFKSSLYWVKHL